MSYVKPFYGRKIVYTEDHVVVRKVFMHHVANELQRDELWDYFLSYGNVTELEVYDEGSTKLKAGHVVFENARDAADVLTRDTLHFVNDLRLNVEAFYSWGQPDVESIAPIPSHSHIMRLNDDCLERIYRNLPLLDQLNLARICRRPCPFLHRYVHLGLFRTMTLWNVRDFLLYFGSGLREIVGKMPQLHRRRYCEFIGAYCDNLRVLRISQSPFSVRDMRNMFSNFRQLEELQLTGCSLTDDALLELSQLQALRKLDLCYNDKLTGASMCRLPSSIESLKILFCSDLQLELLPHICKSLKNLRELSLRLAETDDTDVLRQVVSDNSLDSLESLTIWTNFANQQHFEFLAKLPRLWKLIMYASPPSSLLLAWLVEHKSRQLAHCEFHTHVSQSVEQLQLIFQLSALRVLALPSNSEIDDGIVVQLASGLPNLEQINLQTCKRLTENAVLQLLLNCPKLQTLQLQRCRLLGRRFIFNIIDMLREEVRLQRCQRALPVQLYLYGRPFNEFLLQCPCIASKDVVHLTIKRPETWCF
ncbi:hypothetical protein KR222_011464 [Zaprionus bogoriensis]|nr:hypothetical protein KR222_011464 [Zaprionus bogoriensis]